MNLQKTTQRNNVFAVIIITTFSLANQLQLVNPIQPTLYMKITFFLDDCGNCVGGTTGLYPCYVLHDCAGVANGTAYLDSCKKCVGGTTGVVSTCVKDCAGVWGGKAFVDSCNICVDSIRKQPCDSSYIKKGDSLYTFLNRPEFTDSLNKFKQGLGTDTGEKAISFGIDSRGKYKATGIKISPKNDSVSPYFDYPGIRILKLMHSHPNGIYNCFSNGDMYTLKNLYNNPSYSQINSQYVIASDSSIYAMAIEDTALYARFLRNYPFDSIRGGYLGCNDNLPMGAAFKDAYKKLAATEGLGGALNDDEAFAQAQAYVLSKFNSGLLLYSKKSSETKFSKVNTKVSQNQSGNNIFNRQNCL